MMKEADLQQPDFDLFAGRPLKSREPRTTSSSSGVSASGTSFPVSIVIAIVCLSWRAFLTVDN